MTSSLTVEQKAALLDELMENARTIKNDVGKLEPTMANTIEGAVLLSGELVDAYHKYYNEK